MSLHTFHGHFFVRSTDLLSLPNVNPDAGFGMQVQEFHSMSVFYKFFRANINVPNDFIFGSFSALTFLGREEEKTMTFIDDKSSTVFYGDFGWCFGVFFNCKYRIFQKLSSLFQVSIDEDLKDSREVSFQAALLYTSSRGERRIRVHTLCIPTSPNLQEIIQVTFESTPSAFPPVPTYRRLFR